VVSGVITPLIRKATREAISTAATDAVNRPGRQGSLGPRGSVGDPWVLGRPPRAVGRREPHHRGTTSWSSRVLPDTSPTCPISQRDAPTTSPRSTPMSFSITP